MCDRAKKFPGTDWIDLEIDDEMVTMKFDHAVQSLTLCDEDLIFLLNEMKKPSYGEKENS